MTTILLIRHGLTYAVGSKITGRLPGLHLNETGRQQAARLPERLARWKIDAVYSSPLERAMETATPVATALGAEISTDIAFAEFDFGAWSGVSLAELDQREDWKLFCSYRSGIRAPGGELAVEAQSRVVAALTGLSLRHPDQTVAVFSHADTIKYALMHYLPVPLDHIHRLDIEPSSVSILRLDKWGPVISGVNLLD